MLNACRDVFDQYRAISLNVHCVLVPKKDIAVIPPSPMEGVATDVKDMDVHDIVRLDEVYNIELNWLAFNWRVLHMAAEVLSGWYKREN